MTISSEPLERREVKFHAVVKHKGVYTVHMKHRF